jgi:hypothetical protein
MSKLEKALKEFPRPLIPLIVVDGALKCVAAWKAVRNRQFGWLVAVIFVNSAGVLPLLYLARFQRSAR